MSDVVKRTPASPIVARSWKEAEEVGDALARSGMMGVQNKQQGMIVLSVCQSEGLSLLGFMRTYHIVEGRPSMRADALLARFRERGGRYKILERSAKRAAIETAFEGQALTWEFTMADAERMEVCRDKKGELKKNWRTIPAQMLWARVTSDMVRTLCPEIVAGCYTPEENGDVCGVDVDLEAVNRNDAIPTTATAVDDTSTGASPMPEVKTESAPQREPEAVPVEAVVVDEPPPVPEQELAAFLRLLDHPAFTDEVRERAQAWVKGGPPPARFEAKVVEAQARRGDWYDQEYAHQCKLAEEAGTHPPQADEAHVIAAYHARLNPPVEPVHTFPELGNKWDGKAFTEAPAPVLRAVLASKSPAFTAGHKAGAAAALKTVEVAS